MKNVNTATEPKIEYRPERHTLGIRMVTPRIHAAADALHKEIRGWAKENGVALGFPYLRYHVINMEGAMDIEAGFFVDAPHPGDARVTGGSTPAGRYAFLIYTGGGYAGNKALVEWAKSGGVQWDRWDDPLGDGFRCRYETFLTDPKVEPRKTKWEIEVAIKVEEG
jgi:effector-binding domain-containing protein